MDDDPVVRTALSTVLSEAGYQVIEAPDGRDAISICTRQRIDLLITDLVMPEQEGIDTIRQFKKLAPESKIIAISGAIDPTFLYVAGKMGAQLVLHKPIRASELLAAVQKVIG